MKHTIRPVIVTFQKGRATVQGHPRGAKTGRLRNDRLVTVNISRIEGHTALAAIADRRDMKVIA